MGILAFQILSQGATHLALKANLSIALVWDMTGASPCRTHVITAQVHKYSHIIYPRVFGLKALKVAYILFHFIFTSTTTQ